MLSVPPRRGSREGAASGATCPEPGPSSGPSQPLTPSAWREGSSVLFRASGQIERPPVDLAKQGGTGPGGRSRSPAGAQVTTATPGCQGLCLSALGPSPKETAQRPFFSRVKMFYGRVSDVTVTSTVSDRY